MTARFLISPGASLRGTLRVPGDKSISHRAVILAGLAEGTSHVAGFLESADCLASLRAMRMLGVNIEAGSAGELAITGRAGSLLAPATILDLGNAGTGMRLLAGVLAGQDFAATLSGDSSLQSRPMQRIIDPLALMGAQIDSDSGRAPLVIRGRRPLKAIDYAMPVASAQLKSCLLLAGLFAEGTTVVREPASCRDHTERMMTAMGAPIDREDGAVSLAGPATLKAIDIEIPGDFSSAAFFIAIAAASPGAHLSLLGVGVNPTRTGMLDILAEMGARITLEQPREIGGEPVADLTIEGRELTGIDVDPGLVPNTIDEFPVLFVAAALARGRTRVSGAGELRVKESDRIAAMARALEVLGVRVEETRDGLVVYGAGKFTGGIVESCGDHRVAMALALAGAAAREPIVVCDIENIATSYPQFAAHAADIGLKISLRESGAEASHE